MLRQSDRLRQLSRATRWGRCWQASALTLLAVAVSLLIAGAALAQAKASSSSSRSNTVRLHLSFKAGSKKAIIAKVAAKAAARSLCSLTVSVHREKATMPTLRADGRGRATWQWMIVSTSPSGSWRFQVSCSHGGEKHGAAKRATIITPSSRSNGPIGDPASITTPNGKIAGLGGDGNPFPWHQCTWLAWEKRSDIYKTAVAKGIPALGSRGTSQGVTVYWWDGMMWYPNAKKAGESVGSTPKPNALVSFGPYSGNPYGHVAWVDKVSSASHILIEQCNGFTLTCNEAWINPLTFPGGLEGYIYGGTSHSPPSTPGNVHESADTTSSVTVSWSASSDSLGVSGYSILLNGSQVATTKSTSQNVSGLVCGHTYTIGVSAYDQAGNHSGIASVNAATASCPPGGDTTPPSTPTNLHQTGRSRTAVSVAWNASTDNVAVSGYFVYLNGSHIANETGTSATIGSLLCGHSYTVGVNAYDEASNHSSTTSISVTTSACPTGKIIISPCLDFHSGPGHSYTLIGCIPDGTTISIDCTATGNSVTGPYGATTVWDHTNYGGKSGYVTDAYVYTGVNGAVSPTC